MGSTLGLLNVLECVNIVVGLTDVVFEGFLRVWALGDGFACGSALVEVCNESFLLPMPAMKGAVAIMQQVGLLITVIVAALPVVGGQQYVAPPL